MQLTWKYLYHIQMRSLTCMRFALTYSFNFSSSKVLITNVDCTSSKLHIIRAKCRVKIRKPGEHEERHVIFLHYLSITGAKVALAYAIIRLNATQ
jgi:hypothetical protein